MKIIPTYYLHPQPQDLLQDRNVVTAETVGKQILRVAETTGDTATGLTDPSSEPPNSAKRSSSTKSILVFFSMISLSPLFFNSFKYIVLIVYAHYTLFIDNLQVFSKKFFK